MNNAESVLVVILSIALTVLLVLSIVLIVKLICIVNALKRIFNKTERIGDVLQKTACTAAACRLFARVVNTVFGKSNSKGRKG